MKASSNVRLKMNDTCFACLHRGFLRQLADQEPAIQEEYSKRFHQLRDTLDPDTSCPAYYAAGRELLREYIPNTEGEIYLPIKKMFNESVLEIEDQLQARIDASDTPLELAIKIARAGNYLDLATGHKIEQNTLLELIDRATMEQLDPHTYTRFCADLESAASMVYFTDNAGEGVLDKLLIRAIQKLYPSLNLTVIVRGGIAQGDITLEDAEFIGLTQEARVISSGAAMPGAQLSYLSEEARSLAEEADLLLAKGQGNFEGLSGCGLNVYFLFLCKCQIFTELFHLPQFSGVFLNEQEI